VTTTAPVRRARAARVGTGCAARVGAAVDPLTWEEAVHRARAMHRLRRAALTEARVLAAELRELAPGVERDWTLREVAALRTAASGAAEFAAELAALVRAVEGGSALLDQAGLSRRNSANRGDVARPCGVCLHSSSSWCSTVATR
jgi:hypothetical protein